jgi:Fic family protein
MTRNYHKELLFLKESNAIENVWDTDSLLDSFAAWDYIVSQDRLTPENILKTHAILMEHKTDIPKEAIGAWRQQVVYIGGHEGRPWFAVPTLVQEWCKVANSLEGIWEGVEQLAIDTENLIKADHIAYEAIHPFLDGNGRTGRIFLNWQRLKVGLPILVIRERQKHAYYKWFPR